MTTELQELKIDELHPDPNNPRGKLRGIGELADSIKEVGVLAPLTVRPKDDGGYWVVNGHRRLEAATLAGLSVVPCLLTSWSEEATDVQLVATVRIIENLQRDDLRPQERARAFQQLFDLGHDEKAVAKATGLPVAEVKQAKALVGSAVAMAVAEKYGQITLEQAVGIAEFDGDDEAVKMLTKTAIERPENFPHLLARCRENRKERELIVAAAAKAREEGFAVLDDLPPHDDKARPLYRLKKSADAKSTFTAATHKKCPGHALVFTTDYRGRVVSHEYCLDPVGNGHVDTYSTSPRRGAELSDAEREKHAKERRQVIIGNRAARAAETVRRQFVRELLKRKTLPKGTERYVSETIVLQYFRVEGNREMFAELTGSDAASYLGSLPDTRVVLGLFAYVAAETEGTWAADSWRHEKPQGRQAGYLRYLVSTGYTPASIERVILGELKITDVLAELEAKSGGPAKKATPAKKAAPRKAAARR
jgi:ParB family transcriptional regulator, chromosome partitioning protein